VTLLQDFAREAATITDWIYRRKLGNPETIRYPVDICVVSFMAQLLAHNMSLIKPVSAWPKGASAAIVGFNVTGGSNAYYIVASGCTPFRHYYSGVARRLLEARALE